MNELNSLAKSDIDSSSLRMKELNRLQSRHAWRNTESHMWQSRTKLRANLSTKLLPTFLLVCWTLRTAAGQGTAIPLSDGDIQQIVNTHNLFRSMVEPPASNMQRIVSINIAGSKSLASSKQINHYISRPRSGE